MIVGSRRRSFAKMVLKEQAQDKRVMQQKVMRTYPLPAISQLFRERELMMAAFRKGLAATIPVLNSVTLDNNQDEFFYKKDKFYGRHMLADFIISDAVKKKIQHSQSPAEYIQNLVGNAARHAKAHILNEMAFKQLPDGNIVGLVVIQESHLSIHCLLNDNFVAVDVFTCGEINFAAAVNYIALSLGDHGKPAQSLSQIEVKRGVVKDNRFIQGIGVQSNDRIDFLGDTHNPSAHPSLGRHIIMELYLCNPILLDDMKYVKKVFHNAILSGGGVFTGDFGHQFVPQGVSNATIGQGRFSLGASGYCDLTVHNYPELEVTNFGPYAAVDLCDFSNQINLSAVLKYVVEKFEAEKYSAHVFLRGKYQVDHQLNKVFLTDNEDTVDRQLLSSRRLVK